MISREMFTNELKEFFACVCLNIWVDGWIEPDLLPDSISSCILGWFLEFQCCLVPTVFKYRFVSNLSFVKLSFLTDKLEMHLLVIDGSCLIIDGGCLDFECIYRIVLLDFLKGKYFPVFKLKKTSKKSVLMRFVSIVIDSPSSLNKLIVFS